MFDFTFSVESDVEEALEQLQEALEGVEGAELEVELPQPESSDGVLEGAPPTHAAKPRPPHHQLSSAGEDFIVRTETFGRKPALRPYRVYGGLTIGYGHKVQKGEDFSKGITEARARELLNQDIQTAVKEVNDALEVPISQSQFDALVDFVFNVGGGRRGFEGSTLRRTINTRAHVTEHMFTEYDRAGKKRLRSKGLRRRRVREWEMFEKGEDGRNTNK